MRIFPFLLLASTLYYTSPAYAQLINPGKNWLTEKCFFHQDAIAKHNIKSIEISKSEKPDGMAFRGEYPFLYYEFYKDGKVKLAQKYIPLSRGVDTASFIYQYNLKGQLIKRTEKQGPFQFHYYFFYRNGELNKEVKIDGNSLNKDTSYVRYYQNEVTENKKLTTIINTANKAFMRRSFLSDKQGRMIYTKTSFLRTTHFSEIKLKYKFGLVKSKIQTNFYGKKREKIWEYYYQSKMLDIAVIKENGKKQRKYSISYSDNEIEKAIIERNFTEKLVNIYKLKYDFYD